jgi:predicted neuraminidase
VSKRLPLLFFAVALCFALLRAPQPQPPAFVAPPQPALSSLPAEFSLEKLPAMAPAAHASSLTELADGRLALAWYAGTREGAPDVEIWFSTRDAAGWSSPRVVATRVDTAAETGASVRKLGNPVLYAQDKRLHLWYVSVAVGGWSGSSINHKTSDDGGQSWSLAERLVTSPLFNLATLVRTPPVALVNGELGLPVYHELFAPHAEWLRLAASGRILGKARLPSSSSALQPAVAVIDEHRALALLRSAARQDGTIMADATADGGATWQSSASLPIANHNTSVALLRLRSGRMLLAANPRRGRNLLQLFLSDDDGNSWRPARVIENDADEGSEYSYPALLQTADGRIHLSYTFRRQTIAHAVFSEAAVTEGAP